MSSIQCPNCQAANNATAAFCAECGQRFAPSTAARLAGGITAKLRGDDLALAAQRRNADVCKAFGLPSSNALTPSQPQSNGALDEVSLVLIIGCCAAASGGATLIGLTSWRDSFPEPGYGEVVVVPWLAGHPWPLVIAVALNVLILGRIYVSLLRADRAHVRSSN